MTVLRKGSPEEAGMRPEQIALIQQRGGEWEQQDNTLALVLMVIRHGVICLHEAWGPLTPAADAPPARPDSYFPYSSISKSISAAAVMTLVEEGRVSLTRPVDFYIPELCGEGAQEILVGQLLTHTSGFDGDETEMQVAERLAQGIELPDCPADQHPAIHGMLHALYPLKPHRRPGTQMSYGGANYQLLGDIVRRVSGMSFSDFVGERIFQPLGMHGARVGYDAAIEPHMVCNLVTPFLPGSPVGDEARAFMAIPDPAGSMFGTIEHCAVFAQMLLNGGCYGGVSILQPPTVAQMTRNQIPGIGTDFVGAWHDEASWGYGLDVMSTERWRWFDGSLPANGTFTHSGMGGVMFWVDPHYDLIGLYFSHCRDVDPETSEHHWDCDLFQNMVTAAVC